MAYPRCCLVSISCVTSSLSPKTCFSFLKALRHPIAGPAASAVVLPEISLREGVPADDRFPTSMLSRKDTEELKWSGRQRGFFSTETHPPRGRGENQQIAAQSSVR